MDSLDEALITVYLNGALEAAERAQKTVEALDQSVVAATARLEQMTQRFGREMHDTTPDSGNS